MSDQLKKFVTEHRMEFDTIDPPKDLWEKIDAGISNKNAAGSKNMFLSKGIYFGFGLSILALTVYLDKNSKVNSSNISPSPVVINSASVKPIEDKLAENQSMSLGATPIEILEKTKNEESVQELVKQNEIASDTMAISSLQLEEGETFEEMTEEQIQEAEAEIEAEEAVKKDPVSTTKNKRMSVYIPETPRKNEYLLRYVLRWFLDLFGDTSL